MVVAAVLAVVAVAEAVVDIILDVGVVPLIVQSDQGPEFMNDLLAELSSLLGSRQVFRSSFHHARNFQWPCEY